MVVAGNPPDVVEMPEKWVARFAAIGKLVNLEKYLKDWPELDKFAESALKAMRIYKNEPYIIPYGFYIRIMFYRKDWLEEKGLSVPQTTDEFIEVVKKLTDPSKGRFGTYIRGAVGGWDTIKYWISAYLGTAEYFDEEGRKMPLEKTRSRGRSQNLREFLQKRMGSSRICELGLQ